MARTPVHGPCPSGLPRPGPVCGSGMAGAGLRPLRRPPAPAQIIRTSPSDEARVFRTRAKTTTTASSGIRLAPTRMGANE